MVPSYLMIATVLLLICASFIPEPTEGIAAAIYGLRSGLICLAICIVGVIYTCIRTGSGAIVKKVIQDLDRDTVLLLFGLFMVIEGIKQAGVIDAIAQLFFRVAGESPFLLYTLIVFASVFLSAFIDNIPYVATMLPVVESISGMMGVEPYVFYFGLLTGATLGGNLTPIRQYCSDLNPAQKRRDRKGTGFPENWYSLYHVGSADRVYLYLAGVGNLNRKKENTYEQAVPQSGNGLFTCYLKLTEWGRWS